MKIVIMTNIMKAFFQDIEAEIGQLNGSQKEPETVNKTTSEMF